MGRFERIPSKKLMIGSDSVCEKIFSVCSLFGPPLQCLKMSEFEINGTPVHKLRVVDLKEEMGARGLSKSGKKDELVARLVSFLEAEAKNEEKTEEVEDGSNDSKDEMMKKWQEEREQLLKENEVKRLEEEKTKEEEERKKQEEERKKQEEERMKERKRLRKLQKLQD